LQRFMVYGASILAGAKEPAAASEFVSFLKSESAAAVFRKNGMEPNG
jgi:ABC-type molybdate transport system substrate-binding protein